MKSSILFIVILICCTTMLYSQIPRTLSYQGVLTDSLGSPKPDNNYTVTFRLYDASSGGTLLWTSPKVVTVKRGLFATTLGDAPAFDATMKFDRPYWLSLEVFGVELPQRVPLTSVAYSINAARAETAMVATVSVSDTSWKPNGANIYHTGSNVGIGSSNPTAPLTIQTTPGADLYFPTTGPNADIVADGQLNISSPNFNLVTASQYRFTLLGNGSIGIGTITPSKRLHIADSLSLGLGIAGSRAGSLTLYPPDVSGWYHIDNPGGQRMRFSGGNSPGVFEYVTIAHPGNVGIGTPNPTEALVVANSGNVLLKASASNPGDIMFQNSAGDQKGRIWTSSNLDRQLLLSSKDNVADVAIDSNGNVGIGTTTPGQKLDVSGSLRISGNYYFTTGVDIFSVAGSYSGITDHWIPNFGNSQDLGTATYRWRTLYTNNTPNVSSDLRLKKDIANLKYGLNEVLNLRPVSYRLKEGNGDQTNLGLIAQEVQKLIPEIVSSDDSKEKILGMRYEELIPVLVKAMQEQQLQIEELKTLVRSLAAEKEKSGGKSIGELR